MSTGGTIFISFDIETMARRPSPVLPPRKVTKQNVRWHHAFRQERKARVYIVPPMLLRPSGACASGEARGGTRAHSDVEVALGTALEALQAAPVVAQLAAQSSENRSEQVVARPAWTSVGSTSADSGEAAFVRKSGLSEFVAEYVGGIERTPWWIPRYNSLKTQVL